ncbi:uncharacterized protein LOC108670949 [Hyalella azteca]|uniref:Uncharacterized protein LOC108670949 n=1 Tax=Hyalella azteca TaxID=294128 RepID=A0A8B7NJU9_HYAAZ|nr:uncharacterized protein LOC108670949 [Hyalella azteca]
MIWSWSAVLFSLTVLSSAQSGGENAVHHRSKRYFFINPDSPITLGFLLNMPISLALPTLVDTTPRSLDEYDSEERLPGFEYPEDLYFEPSYEQELGRLQVYFTYLKVPMVVCQERLVCEVAAEPDAFSPLSTLLLKELRQTHGPVKPSHESLLWRFMAASATGYAYGAEACVEYYGECEMPARHFINMPVLKVWQYISNMLNVKLL